MVAWVMDKLAKRAIGVSPIKAPAMNITLGSVGVLALGTALTTWQQAFESVFGDTSDGIRRDVMIATIAAIVVIAATDMFARAIASRGDHKFVVPWGKGWTASVANSGLDDAGYLVAGVRARSSAPEDMEYLLVKADEAPKWHRSANVKLTEPPDGANA